MSEFKQWWDKFYYTEKAQEFCFGNHNNAARDEQVGEFSAQEAWDHQQDKITKLETLVRELVKVVDGIANDECDDMVCSQYEHLKEDARQAQQLPNYKEYKNEK
jgi:hypothetical protein